MRLSPGWRRAAAAAAVAAVVVAALATFALVGRGHANASAPGCTFGADAHVPGYLVSPDQAQNASIISAVGLRLGLPDHAVTVALATSLQESNLLNLPYGDRDSVGLFQQRPSEGWGSRAQILNPVYAATAFFQHLSQIPGWEALPVTEAAQLVQRSASPDAYAQWSGEAQTLAITLTGEVPHGLSCQVGNFSAAAPPSSLAAAAAAELGSPGFGAPVSPKRGWQAAAWAVAHAYNYHLSTVSFAGSTWSAANGAWAPDSSHPADVVVTG